MEHKGGTKKSGPYALICTVGQPDAALVSGGDYELLGGFWPGGPLCFVDFESFAMSAEYWLEKGCNEGNNFCDGADLNYVGGVNNLDLRLFVEEWLEANGGGKSLSRKVSADYGNDVANWEAATPSPGIANP